MTESDAWQSVVVQHLDGAPFDGQVTKVLPFGAFVELADGVQGLLPRTEHSARPRVGASITVRIVTIDVERRRVSLAAA